VSKQTIHLSEQRTGRRDAPAAPPALIPATATEIPPPPKAQPHGATDMGPQERWAMVAQAAYFRAERRGFEPGHEIEDWLAAEQDVEHPMPAARASDREHGCPE